MSSEGPNPRRKNIAVLKDIAGGVTIRGGGARNGHGGHEHAESEAESSSPEHRVQAKRRTSRCANRVAALEQLKLVHGERVAAAEGSTPLASVARRSSCARSAYRI